MSDRLMLDNLWFYDYEVLKYCWLVVFKSLETGEYRVIVNDNDEVIQFMLGDPWLCGFNVKGYDQYINKGVMIGLSAPELKQISDDIVNGHEGWRHPLLADSNIFIPQIDLMDDCQKGLSLKAIEGHLGMDIRESTVPFDLDRPPTDSELDELIYYCKHDVDATERLYDLRKNYLQNKLFLGRAKGIPDRNTLYMTNAKLTAAYLDAKQTTEWKDEREYKIPDNLLRQYIPDEVFQFFDRLKDESITNEDAFKAQLDVEIGGCPGKIGFGGIHMAQNNLIWSEGDAT